MTEQTPNPMPDEEPVTPPVEQDANEAFIPPHYMLILAGIGFFIAFAVLLTQPTFTVVGWGGLGIGLLSLLAWVLMAPQHARAVLTGRTARFGGTSVAVSLIVIVALIAIYTLIRGQEIRVDLTERDTFSLTAESAAAIGGIGADPSMAPIRILAFYNASQAGSRDRDELLFEDYRQTSDGKIDYEFVDPDRNPALAQQYEVTRPGQVVVVALNADGTPDVENAETLTFVNQQQLTNAILRASASGDFRAYFVAAEAALELADTGSAGLSTMNTVLTDQFDWATEEITFLDLLSPESDITLNDPATDGDVMVIVGGNAALTDEEFGVIRDYLDAGGNLVLFAAPTLEEDSPSLALAENLSNYLSETFGIRFTDDIVIDPQLAFQTPVIPVAIDFSTTHYITSSFPQGSGLVFEIPHSIEISDAPPENVLIDELARSGPASYAKTDINAVLEGDFAQADTDPVGPFVLAATAENTDTGARVVLYGSASVPANSFANLNNAVNLDAALLSLAWTTDFEEFVSQITVQPQQLPQDTPLFADQQTLGLINLVTIFLLPFGILLVGAYVWWNRRETAH